MAGRSLAGLLSPLGYIYEFLVYRFSSTYRFQIRIPTTFPERFGI